MSHALLVILHADSSLIPLWYTRSLRFRLKEVTMPSKPGAVSAVTWILSSKCHILASLASSAARRRQGLRHGLVRREYLGLSHNSDRPFLFSESPGPLHKLGTFLSLDHYANYMGYCGPGSTYPWESWYDAGTQRTLTICLCPAGKQS